MKTSKIIALTVTGIICLLCLFGCKQKEFEDTSMTWDILSTTSQSTVTSNTTDDANLKLGDSNTQVTTLQNKLIELGYLKDSATGYFGQATKNAVFDFQKDKKLDATGIADENTQKMLFSESTKKNTNNKPLAGYVIGVDPGHQLKGNSEKEPNAQGSSKMKNKVTSGTTGRWTKVPEHEINLKVSLLLKDMLEEQGATVIMTRTTADVNISNAERAKLFNQKKTDFAIRIHCNGSENSSDNGAFMIVPAENPYLKESNKGANLVIEQVCKQTGAKNMGIQKSSEQTGFNWCERMVMIIEMGHMTNKDEDYKLSDPSYQNKLAKGMADGIVMYFKNA